jgi:hypothetical protein
MAFIMRSSTMRPKRIMLASAGLAAVALTTTLVVSADAEQKAPLSLVAASKERIPVERWGSDLDLYSVGLYVTSGTTPIEFWASRTGYDAPVHATMKIGAGRHAKKRQLADGLVGIEGLKNFLTVSVLDKAGHQKFSVTRDYCGSWDTVRLSPDAPEINSYTSGNCSGHPFVLRTLIGFGPSRGVPVSMYFWSGDEDAPDTSPSAMPDGDYTVKVTISAAWRKLLGVAPAQATASVPITISTQDGGEEGGLSAARVPGGIRNLSEATGPVLNGLQMPSGKGTVTQAKDGPLGVRIPTPLAGRVDGTLPLREGSDKAMGRTASGKPLADPSLAEALASTRTDKSAKVDARYRPDLRPLPAFGFTVLTPEEAEQYAQPGYEAEPNHEYLAFAATVWNAGPGQLVVDGFRTPGADVMRAYQSFYDKDGTRKSYAPTGSMAYDSRPGHQHWHFLDFATYQLRTKSGATVRSQKEAFCLAPTDAIDLGVKNAQWTTDFAGLWSACGTVSALGIRETMPTGWGDTYGQYLPGQAFDITGLPNGTYQVDVIANPDGHLYETSTANNRVARTIVLGGKPGARTVKATPVGLVDAP